MIEQFTLILKHELVCSDGERIELDRPIITKWSSIHYEGPPNPIVINHVLDTLRKYALEQYSEQKGENNEVCS